MWEEFELPDQIDIVKTLHEQWQPVNEKVF